MPAGATEEDGVLSLANAIWRKCRGQKYFQVQLFKCVIDPKHPLYNETHCLAIFAAAMEPKPETAF